jgi:DNA polymerase V
MLIFSCSPQRAPRLLPLMRWSVEAGFPSPAEGQIDEALDLNELLIEHPHATYFVRVRGDSMRGAGIHHGDLLIVDRAKSAKSGDVIVAALNGEFTVKRWRSTLNRHQQGGELIAAHPHYPPIKVSHEDDFMIWGVVCYTIHRP